MTLRQFQKESKRTCPSLGDKLDLAHMVLGIQSETEEFLQAIVKEDKVNIGEEQADQYWYLANYCTFRGYDLQQLHDDRNDIFVVDWENEVDLYMVFISRLQDLVKKYVAYGKPINKEVEENCLKVLLWILQGTNDEYGIDLETILENNIAKLKIRFPDKFTEENAINRNLEQERKQLEKNIL